MRKIPLLAKWLYTAFMAVLVPVYWICYGPTNFLWFSDITLITTFLALLFELPLIASIAAAFGIVLESIWLVDFLGVFFFDIHLIHLADYMFESQRPLGLRLLSLFHVVLPPLLLWLVWKLGYVRKAWPWATLLSWIVIATSWLVTDPSLNINWVYGYLNTAWTSSPALYLLALTLAINGVQALTHAVFIIITKVRYAISQQR